MGHSGDTHANHHLNSDLFSGLVMSYVTLPLVHPGHMSPDNDEEAYLSRLSDAICIVLNGESAD